MNPTETRSGWSPAKRTALLEETHHAAGIVYFRGQDGQKNLPQGWQREPLPASSPPGLADQFAKADAEYLRSPSGQKIVSFRGTSEKKDWLANAGNTFGIRNEKYEAAAKIGEAFKTVAGIVFTGHSLGGGLAKLAGEVASKGPGVEPKTVVGFNAAPITPATYKLYDLSPKDHLRTTIHVVNENDILNRAVKGGKTSAIGGQGHFDRERPDNSMIVMARGEGSVKGATGHGIKNFVSRGETADISRFTAPLSNAAGALTPDAFDRFRPAMPERGRTGVVLAAARGASAQQMERGLGR